MAGTTVMRDKEDSVINGTNDTSIHSFSRTPA